MELFNKILVIFILSVIFTSFCETQEVQPRSIQCSEKTSNGKKVLVCSGFSRIPIQSYDNISFDPLDIHVLDMSSKNHLQTLNTSEFFNAGFENLDTINLANANIRTVKKGAFLGLVRLMKIDLSNNNIDTLDMEAFQNAATLQILQLHGNPIHQFAGEKFPPLPALKMIDLSNCQISKIPINAFQDLPKLQELNLQSNKLARLDWNVFSGTANSLTHLLLRNNTWKCDCHLQFLRDFMQEKRRLDVSNSIVCHGPDSKITPIEQYKLPLTCHPEITVLTPIGHVQSESYPDGDLIVYSEIGKDIGFECNVEGFPAPDIGWQKNGVLLTNGNETDNNTDTSVPHFRIASKELDEDVPYKFHYTKLLTIHRFDKSDLGEYTCVAGNDAGRVAKSLRLSATGITDDGETIPIVTEGEGQTWLWILLAVLAFLIIALLLVLCLFWRKREREKQQKLKRNMLEKFKGSEIVLDDTFSSSRSQKSPNSPLLPQESNHVQGSLTISTLPDVAQGNARSLSPVVFSPRPQSADLRRQFFAAQIQSQHSQPGSLPMVYYGPPQPISRQAGPPSQHQNRLYDYRMTNYPIRRPGSSQSLIYPEQQFHAPRPVLTRQFSGPAYSTMTLRPTRGHGRYPSMSSAISEPPLDRGRQQSFGYVTLPRNFAAVPLDSGFGPSVSPTESNFSSFSYSTLPRQRVNSSGGLVYDSVGPRTTADGGSNLSLNKIGESKYDTLDSINQGLHSPTKGKVKTARSSRPSSSTTPSSMRGFFSFEPIQEVEGSEDLIAQLPSNSEMDQLFPKFQPQMQTTQFRRKKAPQISAIPSRSRKPGRTFEYSKLGGLKDYDFDESLDGDKEMPAESPIPQNNAPVLKSSIENIIEAVEGTEV